MVSMTPLVPTKVPWRNWLYWVCCCTAQCVRGACSGPEEVGDWANPAQEWGDGSGQDQAEEQEGWEEDAVNDSVAEVGKPSEEEVLEEEAWEEEAGDEEVGDEEVGDENEAWEQEAGEEDNVQPAQLDQWPADGDTDDHGPAGVDGSADEVWPGAEGSLFHISKISAVFLGCELYSFMNFCCKAPKMASRTRMSNGRTLCCMGTLSL